MDKRLSPFDEMACALQWCLEHGVKAVDYSVTGYWQCAGSDGREIMPPAIIHGVLDEARNIVMAKAKRAAASASCRETEGHNG